MRKAAGSIKRILNSPDGQRVQGATRHESCPFLVDRIEAKLLHPIETPHIPHIQYERAIGF